jgi:hypothetical protein
MAQRLAGLPLTFSGGYESGTATIDFSNAPMYGGFEKGDLAGFTVGIGSEAPLSLISDSPWWKGLVVMPRLTFRSTSGSFSHALPDVLVLLPGQPAPVAQTVESRLAFTMQEAGLDIHFRYPIWAGLGIKVGMGVAYRWMSTWRLTQNLVEPSNARFVNPRGYPTEDSSRVLVLSDGSEVDFDPRGLVFSYGFVYDLVQDERWTIQPELSMAVRTKADAPLRGGSWLAFAFGGQISVRYLFPGARPDTTPVPPPAGLLAADPIPTKDSIPPPAPLTASIELYTLEGGRRVHSMQLVTRRSSRRQEVALPSSVLFDLGSTTIPERYIQLDRPAASRLSLDSLGRLDSTIVRAHLLNIIGMRMQAAPLEMLRLVVPRDRSAASTGHARAEAIRSYLHDVWGIAPSRLSIGSGNASGSGKESIWLIGSRAILAALSAEWIEETTATSALEIDPRVGGGIAPRSWTLTLHHGADLLARHSSDDRGPLAIALSLETPVAGATPPPLIAELTVRDSSGAIAVARDTLAIVERR